MNSTGYIKVKPTDGSLSGRCYNHPIAIRHAHGRECTADERMAELRITEDAQWARIAELVKNA